MRDSDCMFPKSSTGCSSYTYNRANTMNNALLKMRQNIGKLVTLRTLPQHPTNARGKSTQGTCNHAVDEQQELLAQMIDKGFNNVRGCEFASPRPLTSLECEILKKLIFGSADLCRKCGGADHFASDCTNDTKEEWLRALETIQRGEQVKTIPK